jgi:hypothetical protein
MAGLAVGVIGVILIAGRPEAPARPVMAVSTTPQAPNPDRVRDYQDRLRIMETRAAQEAQAATVLPPPTSPSAYENAAPPPEDPIVAERKRREYESLFASNVVLSHRAENERPDAGRSRRTFRRIHNRMEIQHSSVDRRDSRRGDSCHHACRIASGRTRFADIRTNIRDYSACSTTATRSRTSAALANRSHSRHGTAASRAGRNSDRHGAR